MGVNDKSFQNLNYKTNPNLTVIELSLKWNDSQTNKKINNKFNSYQQTNTFNNSFSNKTNIQIIQIKSNKIKYCLTNSDC